MSLEEQFKLLMADIEKHSDKEGDLNTSENKIPWLKPFIPAGNGEAILIGDVGIKALGEICATLIKNNLEIRTYYTQSELFQVVAALVGEALVPPGSPSGFNPTIPGDLRELSKVVRSRIRDECVFPAEETYVLGAKVFSRASKVDPIIVGPVWFGSRDAWLNSASASSVVVEAARARLRQTWSNRGGEDHAIDLSPFEQYIVKSVGDCDWVCTVRTGGGSAERSIQKAIVAARIGLCAIALRWQRPSVAVTEMGLLSDGVTRREVVVSYNATHFARGRMQNKSRFGVTVFDDEVATNFSVDHGSVLGVVGRALDHFLACSQKLSGSPDVKLCSSLCWFWEACNENLDFLAITKFATAMDVLCDGQDHNSIVKLLESFGWRPDTVVLQDGTTLRKLISEVYSDGRSKFLHGTRAGLDEDLSVARARAEVAASLALKSFIRNLAPGVASN